ncbi:MAG: DUF533 domain-containing protein [Pseudomonadota bacterium]
MNLQNLLDQFMGNAPANNQQAQNQQPTGQTGNDFMAQAQAALGSMGQRATQGGWTDGKGGGFAGGAVVGGLLGAVMGNKKMRKKAKKMGGGLVGYGGSAALGALALKAYQNYTANQSTPQQAAPTPPPPPQPAAISAPQQAPFEVALLKSMISAAYADGHVDDAEREAIYGAVDRLSFDAEGKALVFDLLRNPAPISEIAGYARDAEQASALYVAAVMAIDPDEPVEQRYLADLAAAMNMPAGLKAQIEIEALGEALPAPAGSIGSGAPRFSGKM